MTKGNLACFDVETPCCAGHVFAVPLRGRAQADGMHLCPQEQLGRECLHKLPPEDPRHVDYVTTADDYMRAVLEVSFPHAGLFIYMK